MTALPRDQQRGKDAKIKRWAAQRRENLAAQFLAAAITGGTFGSRAARSIRVQRAIELADEFIEEIDK